MIDMSGRAVIEDGHIVIRRNRRRRLKGKLAMSPSRAVVIEAVKWWRMRRPVGWTLEQHMTNPAVNTASEADKALAIAVGAMGKALLPLENDLCSQCRQAE